MSRLVTLWSLLFKTLTKTLNIGTSPSNSSPSRMEDEDGFAQLSGDMANANSEAFKALKADRAYVR